MTDLAVCICIASAIMAGCSFGVLMASMRRADDLKNARTINTSKFSIAERTVYWFMYGVAYDRIPVTTYIPMDHMFTLPRMGAK